MRTQKQVSRNRFQPVTAMNIDTILRWIIIGVVLLIGASLLGLIIDLGTALLKVALQVLVVVLIVALVARFFGNRSTQPQ